MSAFQVGDKVVVRWKNTDYDGKKGKVFWVGNSGVDVIISGSNNPLYFCNDYVTKIVDAPVSLVGKRVKLTLGDSVVVGTVRYVDAKWVTIIAEGGKFTVAYNVSEWTLEVLPEPIVLPTGKNAIVEFSNVRYVGDGGSFWEQVGGSSIYGVAEFRKKAEKFRDTYRVIFEGE